MLAALKGTLIKQVFHIYILEYVLRIMLIFQMYETYSLYHICISFHNTVYILCTFQKFSPSSALPFCILTIPIICQKSKAGALRKVYTRYGKNIMEFHTISCIYNAYCASLFQNTALHLLVMMTSMMSCSTIIGRCVMYCSIAVYSKQAYTIYITTAVCIANRCRILYRCPVRS